jgi:hypothetical protein
MHEGSSKTFLPGFKHYAIPRFVSEVVNLSLSIECIKHHLQLQIKAYSKGNHNPVPIFGKLVLLMNSDRKGEKKKIVQLEPENALLTKEKHPPAPTLAEKHPPSA